MYLPATNSRPPKIIFTPCRFLLGDSVRRSDRRNASLESGRYEIVTASQPRAWFLRLASRWTGADTRTPARTSSPGGANPAELEPPLRPASLGITDLARVGMVAAWR